MDLVTGALGNLAPKLLQLLGDEYRLHKGLREKVESLSKELKHVHATLRKVAEVPWDQLDEHVKIWADELREKSYDMEDVLDTFLVRVEGPVPSGKKDGKIKRKLKKKMDSLFTLFSKGKARHDIDGAIEDIIKQLKEVAERRAMYKLDDVMAKPTATSKIDPRLVAMNNEVNKLIGIDKSSGELSRMLSPVGNDSNGKMKIVSVVGVGGLGKTTLAQAVYEDYLIEKDPLIWKWIAEGLVEIKTGTSLFQRGEEYFNQLINSSLIQAVESSDGVIDRCRVHDMVLDLIREMSKKVNFVTISNDDGEGTLQRNKQLTQLLCLHGDRFTKAPDGLLKKVTSLEELRLNIDNLDDESKRQFMKDLGNLSQVRVLSIYGELRGGGMALQSELVQSLDNLHKLQHLRLPRASPEPLPAIDEAGLRALGGLPELRELGLLARRSSIASTATVASINISGEGFFQKLRRCILIGGWIVQLVLNKEEEEDSKAGVVSVSFWNGNGAAPFGSRTKQQAGCRRSVEAVPPPVMPNLQYLLFEVPVRALYMDGNGGCDNLGLEFLPPLANVHVIVNCMGATADDVDKAEADLRNAAQFHPNKFIPDIQRVDEHRMIAQSIDKGDEEDGTELTCMVPDTGCRTGGNTFYLT
nr:unnamed protein product [Digitaria exilis]